MIDADDLVCRDTKQRSRKAVTHTIGFEWCRRSTGEVLAAAGGFFGLDAMRRARDAAFRTLTGSGGDWISGQMGLPT